MSSIASLLLWIAYPAIIFFGLQVIEPRYVVLLLGLVMVLRWKHDMRRVIQTVDRVHLAIALLLLCLMTATYLSNSELLLRLYPATISSCMLLMFALSLKYPPTMIEVFARASNPELPPEAIPYTRKVTQIWCLFFIANAGIALYTAIYATRATWSLYNGLISYLLMGTLLGGEWLVRRRCMAQGKSH